MGDRESKTRQEGDEKHTVKTSRSDVGVRRSRTDEEGESGERGGNGIWQEVGREEGVGGGGGGDTVRSRALIGVPYSIFFSLIIYRQRATGGGGRRENGSEGGRGNLLPI